MKRTFGLGTMLATLVAALFVFCGPASAHQVTSIEVDCYVMTAHFRDFPDYGVEVHMAASVNGQSPVSRDVLVTSETTEESLDISGATAGLYGALTIDADITWRLYGWQHVHQTVTVTCASPTTTTTQSTTTTTTTTPETTTSIGELGSTSTVPSTVPVPSTTARPGASTTPTSAALPVSTLPRTGSDPTFPAIFGVTALAAGALALRRRRPWTA